MNSELISSLRYISLDVAAHDSDVIDCAIELIFQQQARIAELEAQAAIGRRAVLGLRALEWSRPVIDRNGFLGRGCIECGRDRERGHTEKCAVSAILCDAERAGMGVGL